MAANQVVISTRQKKDRIEARDLNRPAQHNDAPRVGTMLREEFSDGVRYIAVRWTGLGIEVLRVVGEPTVNRWGGYLWSAVPVMGGL